MATAEDTVLAKLEWAASSGSDRQIADVVAIAANNHLDRTYMHRWAEELGVTKELHQALHAADDVGRSQLARGFQLQVGNLLRKLTSGGS